MKLKSKRSEGVQTDQTEVFSLRLSATVLDDLREEAKDRGLQLAEVVRQAIRKGLTPPDTVWVAISGSQTIKLETPLPTWTGGENPGQLAAVWAAEAPVEHGARAA
jgi:post-segregation antitoxin (ccd killing protein)